MPISQLGSLPVRITRLQKRPLVSQFILADTILWRTQMKNYLINVVVTAVLLLMFPQNVSAQAGCLVCNQGQVISSGGPGTEMTKMINRAGLGSDCSRCRALAEQMDRGGPDWVRQNFDYVVSNTISNAENLGHRMGPLRRSGVRLLVRRSILRSR